MKTVPDTHQVPSTQEDLLHTAVVAVPDPAAVIHRVQEAVTHQVEAPPDHQDHREEDHPEAAGRKTQ